MGETSVKELFKKGRTMQTLLYLLASPDEFNAAQVREAVLTKRMEPLIAILCSLTNGEMGRMKQIYNEKEEGTLTQDIEKFVTQNKKDSQYLMNKLLQCNRSESVIPDTKLCKIHLIEMQKILKLNKQSESVQYFGNFLVQQSYAQIEYTMNRFNMTSEQTLFSIVKKIFGNKSQSGVIAEHVLKYCSNRSGFFAEKLRDSMKGMSTSENVIIGILVSRAEKDLGDIVQHFAENSLYGEGKTLKQWIESSLKGTLRSVLLQIAGLSEDEDSDVSVAGTDYESDAGLMSPTKSRSNQRLASPSPVPKSDVESTDFYSSASGLDMESSVEISGDFDPYEINEEEFGVFILEKVNDKTAKRLMQHLKNGNKQKESDVIKATQIIHVLLFICVLFIKYQEKTHKRPEMQIDKKVLKKSLVPSFNWMLENRVKTHQSIKKAEYKILGKWLKEYAQSKK